MKTFATLLLSASVAFFAGSAYAESVEDYSETTNKFRANETVAPYFDSAYGYAVLPTIGKGGVGIGAARGKGQVYQGGEVTGFITMNQLSFGAQLGGQAYSQIIFLEDKRAYDDFISGNFEFDAEASAVAITASAQAKTGTTGTGASVGAGGTAGNQAVTDYRKGMKVFTIAKGGLMYQAAVSGQKFKFRAL